MWLQLFFWSFCTSPIHINPFISWKIVEDLAESLRGDLYRVQQWISPQPALFASQDTRIFICLNELLHLHAWSACLMGSGGGMNLSQRHWSWKGSRIQQTVQLNFHLKQLHLKLIALCSFATCNKKKCMFVSCTESNQELTERVSAASWLPSNRPSKIMPKIKAVSLCCTPEIMRVEFPGVLGVSSKRFPQQNFMKYTSNKSIMAIGLTLPFRTDSLTQQDAACHVSPRHSTENPRKLWYRCTRPLFIVSVWSKSLMYGSIPLSN